MKFWGSGGQPQRVSRLNNEIIATAGTFIVIGFRGNNLQTPTGSAENDHLLKRAPRVPRFPKTVNSRSEGGERPPGPRDRRVQDVNGRIHHVRAKAKREQACVVVFVPMVPEKEHLVPEPVAPKSGTLG